MNLWIDTEFNGYRGELISMALIDENGLEWYESVGCREPVAWVAENVMPKIGIVNTTLEQMQASLAAFLAHYDRVHVVADWPDDISYLCELLITGPGTRIDSPPMTFEIVRGLDAKSETPHNALADARALRLAHVASLLPGASLRTAILEEVAEAALRTSIRQLVQPLAAMLTSNVTGPGMFAACEAVTSGASGMFGASGAVTSGAPVPLFAKDLGQLRTFDAARLPPRDENGHVQHPDMDGIGWDEFDMGPQLRSIGWHSQIVAFESDASAEAQERYDAGNSPDCSYWTPTPPQGDGWLLAAIYDTEEGPVALFVRNADGVLGTSNQENRDA